MHLNLNTHVSLHIPSTGIQSLRQGVEPMTLRLSGQCQSSKPVVTWRRLSSVLESMQIGHCYILLSSMLYSKLIRASIHAETFSTDWLNEDQELHTWQHSGFLTAKTTVVALCQRSIVSLVNHNITELLSHGVLKLMLLNSLKSKAQEREQTVDFSKKHTAAPLAPKCSIFNCLKQLCLHSSARFATTKCSPDWNTYITFSFPRLQHIFQGTWKPLQNEPRDITTVKKKQENKIKSYPMQAHTRIHRLRDQSDTRALHFQPSAFTQHVKEKMCTVSKQMSKLKFSFHRHSFPQIKRGKNKGYHFSLDTKKTHEDCVFHLFSFKRKVHKNEATQMFSKEK